MWVQPSDGAVCHVMRRRYVLQAQCADASGQAYLQFFNDQVCSHVRIALNCSASQPVCTAVLLVAQSACFSTLHMGQSLLRTANEQSC